MIGGGASVAFATEHFHPRQPVEIPVNGFGCGHRLRLVGVPVNHGEEKFEINLHTPQDIALHFNPRFNQQCVVRNNTKFGSWQNEERFDGFPFEYGKIFTLEFVAQPGTVQIFFNGRLFTEFNERDNPAFINRIEVKGDVHIHSVHVSSH